MKLKRLILKNFRSYKEQLSVDIDDMTAFIGKNDEGKSTILEAMDIFFHDGKGVVKIDKGDINVSAAVDGENDIEISLCFTDLPPKVIIDENSETTLADEYLLNEENNLEIKKIFKNGSATGIKTYIKAKHPTNPACCDLLSKKQKDLKTQVESLSIDCEDKRVNSCLRKAIWNHYSEELSLQSIDLNVDSKDGDVKAIWEKLKNQLPVFSLFQSDRKNTDSDGEIQDPMKIAVKNILSQNDIAEELSQIAVKVKNQLQTVSDRTLSKLKEMDPLIANSLHPNIDTSSLKWPDVFKSISISGDGDIPINKRGSGVRRLVLLNFFRAEAEREQKESHSPGIIYAIEEPETSQHKAYQKTLIESLCELSTHQNVQVIITTHSADIVKCLDFSNLRMVMTDGEKKDIKDIDPRTLPYSSLNEVNYLAFGEISIEYHNELYGYLQAYAINENPENGKEKKFEAWLETKGCVKCKNWVRVDKGVEKPPYQMTLHTYIRNEIHHPENTCNVKYTSAELKQSIEELRSILTHHK